MTLLGLFLVLVVLLLLVAYLVGVRDAWLIVLSCLGSLSALVIWTWLHHRHLI